MCAYNLRATKLEKNIKHDPMLDLFSDIAQIRRQP